MLPTILGGQSTEDYLQENVLRPLGMSSTTYYPFGPEFDDRLLPVRYAQSTQVDSTGREEMLAPGEDFNWEVLNGQLDLLTLPRR
jgi:CubicO group peptidase (beta-lactamase class C family)